MSLIRGLVSARTWLAFINHLVGLALGIVSFVIVVTGFTVGLATTPLALVGFPVIGLAVRFCSAFACVERARCVLFLARELPRWPADPRRGYWWKIVPTMTMMRSRATLGEVGYGVLPRPARRI